MNPGEILWVTLTWQNIGETPAPVDFMFFLDGDIGHQRRLENKRCDFRVTADALPQTTLWEKGMTVDVTFKWEILLNWSGTFHFCAGIMDENKIPVLFAGKNKREVFSEYIGSVDFIILYDVLHGIFNYTKSDWGETTKLELIDSLVSLLKQGGILSLALYDEIEHKRVAVKTKNGKDSFKSEPIPHDEAIKPYIELMESSGLALHSVIENGGVHFDDFHNPTKWRKYGEVKVNSLDRRNIYNFIK